MMNVIKDRKEELPRVKTMLWLVCTENSRSSNLSENMNTLNKLVKVGRHKY